MMRARLFVLLVSACGLAAAADPSGIRCTSDGGPINPAFMVPRPVLLQLPDASGRMQEFDLTPELVAKIVDAQTPEFLTSRVQGRVVRRLKETPMTPGQPKT